MELASSTMRVRAEVSGPNALVCPVDGPFSEQPVLTVWVQNEMAEDLLHLLRSQRVRVETEPAVWLLSKPGVGLDHAAAAGPEVGAGLDEGHIRLLLEVAEASMPSALLEGSGSGF